MKDETLPANALKMHQQKAKDDTLPRNEIRGSFLMKIPCFITSK
jgi:hypothetical protein